MAKLTAAARRRIPSTKFALPKNALSRSTQMVKRGKLSPASAEQIKAKANRILGK